MFSYDNLSLQLYDIRAMKELESFRGHRKDVTGKKLLSSFSVRLLKSTVTLPALHALIGSCVKLYGLFASLNSNACLRVYKEKYLESCKK